MILVSIFLFLIFGFIFSRVIVYIDAFDLENNQKDMNTHFYVKLKFKLYGVIPIFIISFKDNGIYILGFKIDYTKILNSKKIQKGYKKFKNKFKLTQIEDLNPSIEKLNLKLSLGTENIVITSFLVTVSSFILSYVFKKHIKKYDKEKYSYLIKPDFNEENKIKLEVNGIFKIKTTNIIESII